MSDTPDAAVDEQLERISSNTKGYTWRRVRESKRTYTLFRPSFPEPHVVVIKDVVFIGVKSTYPLGVGGGHEPCDIHRVITKDNHSHRVSFNPNRDLIHWESPDLDSAAGF